MFRVAFRTVLVGPEDVYLTNEDCGVAIGSNCSPDTRPQLWLPSADVRGQVLFLVKSHNDRVDVAVLTLQDDKIVHHEIFDGVLLGVQGENVLLVASGAGAWHVVTSSNPVWLKR